MGAFVLLLFLSVVLLLSPDSAGGVRVRRQNLKVRISAAGDTIVLKFVRPTPDTKLEGFILGYGSSMFSKQYIPLPGDGQPYEAEIDAEPKYLIAVQPANTNEVKKPCKGKVELEKPLHLVIGSVTPTSVLLSFGTLLKTPYTEANQEDCIDEGQYTVRYKEEPSSTWNYQHCPTSDTVIDKLKPDTPYEFEVRADTRERSGDWSPVVIHSTTDKAVQEPFKPIKPVRPIMSGPEVFFPPRKVVMNRTLNVVPLIFRNPAPPALPKSNTPPLVLLNRTRTIAPPIFRNPPLPEQPKSNTHPPVLQNRTRSIAPPVFRNPPPPEQPKSSTPPPVVLNRTRTGAPPILRNPAAPALPKSNTPPLVILNRNRTRAPPIFRSPLPPALPESNTPPRVPRIRTRTRAPPIFKNPALPVKPKSNSTPPGPERADEADSLSSVDAPAPSIPALPSIHTPMTLPPPVTRHVVPYQPGEVHPQPNPTQRPLSNTHHQSITAEPQTSPDHHHTSLTHPQSHTVQHQASSTQSNAQTSQRQPILTHPPARISQHRAHASQHQPSITQPQTGVTQNHPVSTQPTSYTAQHKPGSAQPQTSATQHQPSSSRPKSHKVQHKPISTQPKSYTTPYHVNSTQPQSHTTQDNPLSTQPQTSATQHQPSSSRPKPRIAQQKPSSTQPKSHTTPHHPSSTQPKSHTTQDSPVSAQPHASATQHQPISTQPESHTTQHQPISTQPKSHTTPHHPSSTQPKSHTTPHHPSSTQPKSHTTQDSPVSAQPHASATQHQPISTQPESHTTQHQPASTQHKYQISTAQSQINTSKQQPSSTSSNQPHESQDQPTSAQPKSHTAQNQPPPTQPKTHTVQHKTGSVQPEDKTTQHQSSSTKPKSRKVQRKPNTVQPKSHVVEHKPGTTRPKSHVVQRKPSSTRLKSHAVPSPTKFHTTQHQPSSSQPKPHTTQPSLTLPLSHTTQHEFSSAHPQTHTSQHQSASTQPQSHINLHYPRSTQPQTHPTPQQPIEIQSQTILTDQPKHQPSISNQSRTTLNRNSTSPKSPQHKIIHDQVGKTQQYPSSKISKPTHTIKSANTPKNQPHLVPASIHPTAQPSTTQHTPHTLKHTLSHLGTTTAAPLCASQTLLQTTEHLPVPTRAEPESKPFPSLSKTTEYHASVPKLHSLSTTEHSPTSPSGQVLLTQRHSNTINSKPDIPKRPVSVNATLPAIKHTHSATKQSIDPIRRIPSVVKPTTMQYQPVTTQPAVSHPPSTTAGQGNRRKSSHPVSSLPVTPGIRNVGIRRRITLSPNLIRPASPHSNASQGVGASGERHKGIFRSKPETSPRKQQGTGNSPPVKKGLNLVPKPKEKEKVIDLKQKDPEPLKPYVRPRTTERPRYKEVHQTTTPAPASVFNVSRFDNSSGFSSVPASKVDAGGKERYIAPHVVYKTDKRPEEPCSITDSLSYFPDEEAMDLSVTAPPRTPPSNLTVVTVEGCPSFVILDWEKTDNETTEYEVVSSTKGPEGEEVSVQTTNQTHTAVENLKPESSYEFKVTPKNELGTGPSTEPVTFSTESSDPRVSEVPTGKTAIWSSFSFESDSYSECNGMQYVKRTWYRKFVGIQLCNSLRYKIYLSDSLKGKFYDIGDQRGHGEDHCQFVDSNLDGRTGVQMPSHQLPSRDGYFRAVRQQPVSFGEIGGNSHINYVSWYECGVPIPGKW